MKMSEPSSSRTLAVLLARTAAGDKNAFADLHARTSAKLFGVTIRILGRRDVAEDVLQECYISIWQRADSYNADIASPIAWMATIARNKAIDAKRTQAERLSASGVPIDDDLPADMLNPLDEALRSDQLEGLLACLNELSEERRQMILLAYLQGWNREEIGAKFSRPVATVKTILRRSLAIVKGCLDGR